jgi:hypothetical protein
MKELIQLTTLLNKALVLLCTESENKEKHIEALRKGQRADLSPEFQKFLIEKTEKEYNDISSFICRCEKYIDTPECEEKEVIKDPILTFLDNNEGIKKKLLDRMNQKNGV